MGRARSISRFDIDCRKGSPLLEVRLRADDDAGNLLDSTKVDDLVVYDLDHVERIPRGDGIHEDEAMDTDSMLGVENRVFVLKFTER